MTGPRPSRFCSEGLLSICSRVVQHAIHMVRIAGDELQIGLGGLIGNGATLFPVPQRANRYVIAKGKFFLRQLQGAADYLGLRRSLHHSQVCFSKRLCVRIGTRGTLDCSGAHLP